MINRIHDLKNKLIETGIDLTTRVTEVVFDQTTRFLEQWGPVIWEKISRYIPDETITDEPTELEPVTEAPAPSVEVTESKEVQPEPEVVTPSNSELLVKIEKLPFAKLKTAFAKDQMLKIIYSMARTEKEWLTPREISELCKSFQFEVLPGNVRKALQNKGITSGLVESRPVPDGKNNAKEYHMTPVGFDYLVENLLSN
ncbi:hypothetical protein KKF34_07910 [Myxococcota bacterium]|nr:hypothetical protein [Myxococcota bacterium]MBU1379383.1 hypothetical protein [Myxococcota bacterium]MBU1496785.1 hypothetical protein [Myxococcota bacterium]